MPFFLGGLVFWPLFFLERIKFLFIFYWTYSICTVIDKKECNYCNCIHSFCKNFPFSLLPKQPHSLKNMLHSREQFQVSTQAEEVGGDEEDVIFVVKKWGNVAFRHFLKGLRMSVPLGLDGWWNCGILALANQYDGMGYLFFLWHMWQGGCWNFVTGKSGNEHASSCEKTFMLNFCLVFGCLKSFTFLVTNISHLCMRKITFPATFEGDMLVPCRVVA